MYQSISQSFHYKLEMKINENQCNHEDASLAYLALNKFLLNMRIFESWTCSSISPSVNLSITSWKWTSMQSWFMRMHRWTTRPCFYWTWKSLSYSVSQSFCCKLEMKINENQRKNEDASLVYLALFLLNMKIFESWTCSSISPSINPSITSWKWK